MSVAPAHNSTRLAAAIVVAAVVIGAVTLAVVFLGTSTRQTVTRTETEPNGSLLLSKTWGLWSYDVLMNSTSVRVGGALLVSGTLTYHGQTNITIDEVEPINGLSVYNSTGGMVWDTLLGR